MSGEGPPVTRGVSVVVPAYDEERAIECCLDELQKELASVDRECELIVVDDGSRTAPESWPRRPAHA